MKYNHQDNQNYNKYNTSDSCDKKCNKPIIPKIKSTSPQDNFNHHKKSTPQHKSKSQKQNYHHGPQFSASHIKNFPKQQDLQKMSKKQLAQTYYDQFLRLHKQNQVLDKQLAYVRQQRDILYKRWNQLKQQQRNSQDQKPKRQRRVATQILRNYNCPVDNCDKSYGSEGSMIQHIKLKHQEFFGTMDYYAFLNKQIRQDQ